ncbi:MAG: ATP-binding protein [Aggregatilineales bacterium]
MLPFDAEQPTYEDIKLLAEVSQLLTVLDLDQVIERVIQLTSEAVGAARASLILRDDSGIDWEHTLLARNLDPRQSVIAVSAVFDEGLAGWVVRHRQGAVVFDTQQDSRWRTLPDDNRTVRSALCVPFMRDNEVVAVLTLDHAEPHHFDERDLRLVTIVANQAVVALRNAQLFNRVQSQQRQLEVVLHAIPDVLFVLDEDGRVILLNDAACKLLGQDRLLPASRVVGTSLRDYADNDTALAPVLDVISRGAHPSELWPFETRSEQTGRDYQVTMSIWEQPREGGRRFGYVIVMHDVTTLRDLHRFKDEVLKIVSHDLRSPLAQVITAFDLLRTDLPLDDGLEHVRQCVTIIDEATARMNKLIEHLLAEGDSRIEIDPRELIVQLVNSLRHRAAQKQQRVESVLSLDEVPRLMVDPMLIREAMENYLTNAIKYTPDGGAITVRAYGQDERFYFVVEDTGCGLLAEDLPNLFTPHYRSDREETRDIEGVGLGLSLVKRIVQRYGGDVWAENREEGGSHFGLWLPL